MPSWRRSSIPGCIYSSSCIWSFNPQLVLMSRVISSASTYRHQTMSATCINKVVKIDGAGGTVLAFPGCRDWTTNVCHFGVFWDDHFRRFGELDGLYFDAIEYFCATFPGVSECEIICFGADHVPRVCFWPTSGNESVPAGILVPKQFRVQNWKVTYIPRVSFG